MKIFLSWSGNQSHLLAQAFREWLPSVFQSVKVFVSSKDIHAGVQWFPKLKTELEETGFGIVCLTRSNLTKPYIMLESGAIAMRVGDTKLVPILCDLSEAELGKNPLTAFNYVHLSKGGIWKLAQSINDSLEEDKRPADLEKTFNKWWAELDGQIKAIIAKPDSETPKKKINTDVVLEEILSIVRGLARKEDVRTLMAPDVSEDLWGKWAMEAAKDTAHDTGLATLLRLRILCSTNIRISPDRQARI